jgi:hypothetical protein
LIAVKKVNIIAPRQKNVSRMNSTAVQTMKNGAMNAEKKKESLAVKEIRPTANGTILHVLITAANSVNAIQLHAEKAKTTHAALQIKKLAHGINSIVSQKVILAAHPFSSTVMRLIFLIHISTLTIQFSMELMIKITADAERSAAMNKRDGLIATIQTLVNNAAINQEM